MQKLRLDVDALSVQSFGTTDAERNAPGTVFAREAFMRTFSRTECHTNCSCPPTPLL